MENTFTNQANVSYLYEGVRGSAQSNISSLTIPKPLDLSVMTLGSSYRKDSVVVYLVSITNRHTSTLSDIKITDNLGTYNEISSLEYLPPADLFTDGVFTRSIDADVFENSVSFDLPDIAAASTVLLIYRVRVKNTAGLESGSETVSTVTADSSVGSAQATVSVIVDSYADVRIVKALYPDTLAGSFVCELRLYNGGNVDATNVVLNDVLTAKPDILSVTLDGEQVSDYSYDKSTGQFIYPRPDSGVSLSVEGAQFSRDAVNGVVSVTPSEATLLISARLS